MIGLVAIAGVTAGFLVLRATFSIFRVQPMLVVAKRIAAAECPLFFDRLKTMCAGLSVRVPDNVIVGLEPNFFVTTSQIRLHPGNVLLSGETLYVSLPLCRTFTKPELDGVVGHELGHFIGDDAIYSQRFAPAYVTLQRAIAAIINSSRMGGLSYVFAKPALFMLQLCMLQFAKVERKIGRQRELAADAVGAGVSSNMSLATALLKVGMYSGFWPGVRQRNIESLEAGNMYKNLSAFFASAGKSAYQNDDLNKVKEQVASVTTSHPVDTHPPTGARIQALGLELGAIGNSALVVPEGDSAATLFDSYESIEEALTLEEHRIVVATGQAVLPETNALPEHPAAP
jgi:Zn-dependent protease with chaperone function